MDKLPEADLWCGGFPCQDISNAGKQTGIRGSRSGLFFDWMRAVRMVRPKYMLVENVAALLHRGMGEVCGELAESGYDAEWDCIPAAAVGAPHRRDRVFIVADSNAQRQPQSEGGVKDVGRRSCDGNQEAAQVAANSECGRLQGRVFGCAEPPAIEFTENCRTSLGTHVGPSWETEPGEGWLDDELPGGMAEVSSRLFGNAVVPQVAEYIGRLLVEAMA